MPCKSKTPLHDINEPAHKLLYILVAGYFWLISYLPLTGSEDAHAKYCFVSMSQRRISEYIILT